MYVGVNRVGEKGGEKKKKERGVKGEECLDTKRNATSE
jgi:hypothetical protein